MRFSIFVPILIVILAGTGFSFIHPDYVCPNVADDSCILIDGAPCFNDYQMANASGCQGQWNEGFQMYMLWESDAGCFCPYVYPPEEKCKDVRCFDKCEGSAESRSGACNKDTGLCEYGTINPCQYGCDGDFCADAPEPTTPSGKGCTVSTDAMFAYCKAYCQSKTPDDCSVTAASTETPGVLYSCMCMCGESSDYTYPSYSQLDCTRSAPARMTKNQPQDKCANVRCDDKCDGNTLKSDGNCDEDTGGCWYTETPCGTAGCNASSLACIQPAAGKIAGTLYYTEFMGANGEGDSAGKKVPLRFVMVKAEYTKDTHRYGTDKYFASTDKDGKFSIDVPAEFFNPENSEIGLEIILEDSGKRVYISTDSWNSASKPQPYTISLSYPPTDPTLSNLDIDLYNMKGDAPAAAQIYANTLRAVEFKENILGLSPTTGERVTIFSNSGTWHMTELAGNAVERGMFIKTTSSGYFNYEAPMNREFHEYCHHIQAEALGQASLRNPPGKDHAGYFANSQSSEWGFIEGWAEFCALQMKKQYYGISDGRYPALNTLLSLELNYRLQGDYMYDSTRSNPVGQKFAEELAIAGIMLDLHDSASDYGSDDDSVSMPLSDIWAAVSGTADFQDGQGSRHVHTVADFYRYLIAANPSLKDGIDEIFIKHGAFQDLNKNGRWDSGEPIGYSGIGSAQTDYRPDLEPEPGTQVMVSAKDGSGNALGAGTSVDVSVSFEGSNSYLSYNYQAPVVDGMIYLPLPPREYNATITMTAVQASSGAKATNTYTTTTTEAYEKLDPAKPLATYDATLPSATGSAACSSDGQCASWRMGDTCQSGKCIIGTATTPGQNGQSGSDSSGCCGPSLILLTVLAGAFFTVRK